MIKILKSIFVPKSYLLVFVRNSFWAKLFVWLTIFLSVLAVFSIWGANSLERLVSPVKHLGCGQIILEVYPETTHQATSSKQEIIEAYLRGNDHIKNYHIVSEAELKSVLSDWLMIFDKVEKNLPLPLIFDITLTDYKSYGAEELQMALSDRVSNVFAQSSNNIASKLTSTLDFSKGLTLLILFVLIFIVFTVVLFATLGLVYSQRESLEVTSFLGASYGDLAKEMAIWIFKYSLQGCLIGVGSAILAVQLISIVGYHAGWAVPSTSTMWLTLGVLIFMPLEATIVALFCVRRTITWIFN